MSNIETIDHLCSLLIDAIAVLRVQAEILAMHGIEVTDLSDRSSALISEAVCMTQPERGAV